MSRPGKKRTLPSMDKKSPPSGGLKKTYFLLFAAFLFFGTAFLATFFLMIFHAALRGAVLTANLFPPALFIFGFLKPSARALVRTAAIDLLSVLAISVAGVVLYTFFIYAISDADQTLARAVNFFFTTFFGVAFFFVLRIALLLP